jgi:hypothetical protein
MPDFSSFQTPFGTPFGETVFRLCCQPSGIHSFGGTGS